MAELEAVKETFAKEALLAQIHAELSETLASEEFLESIPQAHRRAVVGNF